MAVRSGFLLGAFCVFCPLLPAQPPAAPRRALVIANSNYDVLPKVPASSANADAVKTALESLHFQVVAKHDLNQRALRDEITAFTDSLKPGDIVFFYYSGYGTDLEGDNYLLPTNFIPKDTRVPSVRAFLIGSLLDKLDELKTGQRIVVLDSSWDCPPLQSNGQGLSAMQPQHDRTLVSFNTTPGSVTKPPAGNSPSRFTTALVEALKKPGLTVSDVFNEVQKSGFLPGDQRPFVAPNAIENFAFIPAKKEEPKIVTMERPLGPGERRVNARDQLTYVWIPAGPFQMGCVPADTKCKPEEKPAHPVSISKDFWITNSEITLKAYRLFLKANPNHPPPGKTKLYHGGLATEVPVTMVSWQSARDYCNWAGDGGNLPTEAQWEYAARGGRKDEIYPWGNSQDAKTQANYHGTAKDDMTKAFDETTPIKSFSENGWHLYDMAGNVREWVADMFDPAAYKAPGPFTDPLVRTGKGHVVRGGSWNSSDSDLRISYREGARDTGDNTTGFRCVLQKLEAQ